MMKEELWISVNTQVEAGKEIRLEPVGSGKGRWAKSFRDRTERDRER